MTWQDISSNDDVDILRGHAGSRSDIEAKWGALIDDLDGNDRKIFAACVTDTLHDGDDDAEHAQHHQGGSSDTSSSVDRASLLAHVCRRRRIPINVTDKPLLCDFSFPATHRFPASSSPLTPHAEGSKPPSSMSSLQIAVTTNGRGCRLAGRIRREIVSALPRNVGDAVERVGEMRDLARGGEVATNGDGLGQASGFFEEAAKLAAQTTSAQASDSAALRTSINSSAQSSRRGSAKGTAEIQEDDLNFDTTPLNSPVPQLSTPASRSGLPTHSRQHSHSNLSSTLRTTQLKTAAVEIEAAIRADQEEAAEKTKRRMRWVAQISEYWPMEYLGGMGAEQMREALRSFGEDEAAGLTKASSKPTKAGEEALLSVEPQAISTSGAIADDGVPDEDASSRGRSRAAPLATGSEEDPTSLASSRPRARSQHSLAIFPPPPPRSVAQGHIYLVGSGPGHPGLLTLLGHRLLTSPSTHLVLSDKLVPAPILRLIPSTTPLIIAKKFPGNAEGAQSELISLALKAALEEGKNVVRLKQGDPFVYGRGGEEVLAFRERGVECTVIPGISSAIAAPLMVGLPVTQRGSADSLVLCTGVGRGGKKVKLPGYDRGRSLIVLMGVARLGAVVDILTKGYGLPAGEQPQAGEEDQDRTGPPFPPHTPIAIIERASSSDQRLLASTLSGILSALESSGEQRPPGMILIGWAVLSLEGKGNVDVLDDEHECLSEIGGEEGQKELKRRDEERVKRWLNGREYVVKEGLDAVYAKALTDLAGNVSEDGKAGGVGAVHSLPSAGNGVIPAEPTNGVATVAAACAADPAVDGPATATAAAVEVDHSLSSRSSTGWAQGRYTAIGKPEGGWGQGEKRFVEADGGAK